MVEIIKEHNVMQVFDRIADDVQSSADRYVSSKANIGTILFDMRKNIIGVSKGFKDWKRSL
jgi:cobalamin biosynthesis protein CbiD